MILLDTHIWIWWVNQDQGLSAQERQLIAAHEPTGLGVSVISCWEVAMLVSKQRLVLNLPVDPRSIALSRYSPTSTYPGGGGRLNAASRRISRRPSRPNFGCNEPRAEGSDHDSRSPN